MTAFALQLLSSIRTERMTVPILAAHPQLRGNLMSEQLSIDESSSTAPRAGSRRRSPNGTREATREPSRTGTRDTVWYGRDDEVLTRKQTALSDPYTIPPELTDPNWSLQWNSVSVVNSTEVVMHHDSMMQANGWRPVPADRPGFRERFGMSGPKNPSNCIIVGGLRLDERPMGMTEDAKRQEYRAATGQIRERDAAILGGKAALQQALEQKGLGVAQGFKGRKTQVQLDIDPEAPRPSYEYATGEE
jgi:hypothetical protein